MDWINEYITVENLTLIVAIVTLIVTCLSYRYNRRSDKLHKCQELQSKIAQLQAMEHSMNGIEFSAASYLHVEIAALQAEIEQLKKQL